QYQRHNQGREARVHYEACTCAYHLSLSLSAWESIEDEALGALRFLDRFADNASNDIVADQLAGVHDRLGLSAHLAARLHCIAQHISSGQVAEAELLRHQRSLGSLTSTRRA